MKILASLVGAIVLSAPCAPAQNMIVGADVSFLRQMESKGVVYKDAGVA